MYAGIGSRLLAVLLDTAIVFIGSSFLLLLAGAAGLVDLGFLRATTIAEAIEASRRTPFWLMPAEQLVMFAYFTLFELSGATPGKRACRLCVTMDNGTPVTRLAAITRNAVRIPEFMLYYIPSILSCLLSPSNKRVGDLFAHTVVIRRERRLAGAGPAPTRTIPDATPRTQEPREQAAGGLWLSTDADADQPLSTLKAAALATYGAHLNYLRQSNAELERDRAARRAADSGGAPATHESPPEREYSPEYVAAWHTLTATVAVLQRACPAATVSAAGAPTTLDALIVEQPDLAALLRELEPYLGADSAEEIYAACLRVARSTQA